MPFWLYPNCTLYSQCLCINVASYYKLVFFFYLTDHRKQLLLTQLKLLDQGYVSEAEKAKAYLQRIFLEENSKSSGQVTQEISKGLDQVKKKNSKKLDKENQKNSKKLDQEKQEQLRKKILEEYVQLVVRGRLYLCSSNLDVNECDLKIVSLYIIFLKKYKLINIKLK